jgi:hypothetical protein
MASEFIDLPLLGQGTGAVTVQRGTTTFDQNTTATGDILLQIPINASDYQFGTAQITIPITGTFTNTITISKRGLTCLVFFTTTSNDAHSIASNAYPMTVYPGYIDVTFVPYGFGKANDARLSDNSFAANGNFSSGAPNLQLINIKSVQINGANINITLNRPSGTGTVNLVFKVDWRVWKIAA